MAGRRWFGQLALMTVLPVAGCATGREDGPTTNGTPTEPSLRECPDVPEKVQSDTASEFAVEFERAYAWNHALASTDHVSDIDLKLDTPPAVEPAGEGYRVTIDEVFVGITGSMGMADESYIANYYVTDERFLRAESQTAAVDAMEEGTEPDCRPG